LLDRGYQPRCVIIGSGPQEELLRRLILELELTDWVELLGWLDQTQVRTYLEEATIFALPCVVAANGDQDGIPAVLMEAMAMAKPCVSTTVSGIPELIEPERSGLAVPEKDETALADALTRLLDDPQLANRLGQAGQQKVHADFNLDTITDQLLHLFIGEITRLGQSKTQPAAKMLTCVQK
jgi:glycosyltransferase involved in cell wall biosynthesis